MNLQEGWNNYVEKIKKNLSFTLSILIFTSIFFSFPITTNAAVVEESGVGAGNQNVIDAPEKWRTWIKPTKRWAYAYMVR